jgi:excinuclease ABC subunit A
VILEGAGDEQFDIVYSYKGRIVRYQHRYGGIYEHIRHTYANTNSAPQRGGPRRSCGRPCKDVRRRTPQAGEPGLPDRRRTKTIHDLVQMDLVSLSLLRGRRFEERQAIIAEPIVKEIASGSTS